MRHGSKGIAGRWGFHLTTLALVGVWSALGCGGDGGNGASADGGASGSGSVDRSTLSEGALVGTWKHVSISSTPDGSRTPVDADIAWTFNDDGTAVYMQMGSNNEVGWSLDGKDIQFGGQTQYTVVSYETNKMTWKNHALGDYYHVERQ